MGPLQVLQGWPTPACSDHIKPLIGQGIHPMLAHSLRNVAAGISKVTASSRERCFNADASAGGASLGSSSTNPMSDAELHGLTRFGDDTSKKTPLSASELPDTGRLAHVLPVRAMPAGQPVTARFQAVQSAASSVSISSSSTSSTPGGHRQEICHPDLQSPSVPGGPASTANASSEDPPVEMTASELSSGADPAVFPEHWNLPEKPNCDDSQSECERHRRRGAGHWWLRCACVRL